MSELLDRIVAAHGGATRWNDLTRVEATIVTGGSLWGMKGLVQDSEPRQMTVWLHEERASVTPFGAPDQRTAFTADRIAIEKLDGTVVAERTNPRSSFEGHGQHTSWDPLHRAYFNGYAVWSYLTAPFFLTMEGVSVEPIVPWTEGSERWFGLRARFPDYIASHSPVQDFYFGDDFLMRRFDYHVDIAGGFAVAQYVHDYEEADGIKFPAKRRAYMRLEDGKPDPDELLVSIDFSNVRYFRRSLARPS